jgi:hypothetical protein
MSIDLWLVELIIAIVGAIIAAGILKVGGGAMARRKQSRASFIKALSVSSNDRIEYMLGRLLLVLSACAWASLDASIGGFFLVVDSSNPRLSVSVGIFFATAAVLLLSAGVLCLVTLRDIAQASVILPPGASAPYSTAGPS